MKVLKVLASSNRTSFPGCCIIKQLTGLSKEVLQKMQSKASKESAASQKAREKDPNLTPTNDGPIFVKTFYSDEEMQLLTEQLNYYGLIYEIDNEGCINIIGAKDSNGNVLAQTAYPTLKDSEGRTLPADESGTWLPDGEASKGNGRFMPKADEKPIGHPVNIPDYEDDTDEEKKKKENKRTRNLNEEKTKEKVDLVLDLYDKDGNPKRYPWGVPGSDFKIVENETPQPENIIDPSTVIAQVEYYVRKHRERHPELIDPNNNPYKFQGVLYENDLPVMDEFSMGTVEMGAFSSDRDINFKNADQLMAEQLNAQGKTVIDKKTGLPRPITAKDVENYRKDNDLTWHEDPSCSKMMKVPTILHANVPHSGGISDVTAEGQESFYGGDDMVKSQKDAIKAQNAADKALTNDASDAAEKQAKADEAQAVFDKKAAPTVERQAAVIKDAKPANENANIKVRTQQSPAVPGNESREKTGDNVVDNLLN